MSRENYDYQTLSRNGLIHLCTDYDEANEHALKDFWAEQEELQRNGVEPMKDENGYIIPIVYEEVRPIERVIDGIDNIKASIVDGKTSLESISKSIKDGLKDAFSDQKECTE